MESTTWNNIYQSFLNEYLASNGFIVICAERTKNKLPMAWDLDNEEDKKHTFNDNLSDLEAVYNFAKNRFRKSEFGLLSWSYGEEMAAMFCQNHPELKVVIGLSSIRYNAKGIYIDIPKNINNERLTIPHVLIYEQFSRKGNLYDSTLLHPMLRPISQLNFLPELAHGNFNFIEGFLAGILNTGYTQGWSKGGRVALNGYLQICDMTLGCLKRYFTNKKNISTDLKNVKSKHKSKNQPKQ